MEIKFIILIIILFVFFGLALWYNVSMILSLFKKNIEAPYVPSFNRHLKLIKQIKLQSNKKLVDLWCWDGKAMRFFLKNFWIKSEWFDINYFALLYWKLINFCKWIKWLKLIHKNFLQVDIGQYDYIYVYLFPEQLALMEKWIFENIKKNAIVISNSFRFAKQKPFQTVKNKHWKDSIFLYKK